MQLLNRYTSDDKEKRPISVKRIGELHTEAWAGPFQEIFSKYTGKYGWEYHMAEVISKWDTILRLGEFHPFKKI